MAKAVAPWHLRARLARIELPRMHVEHHRLPLSDVDAPDAPTDDRNRQESEVAASANRKVDAQESGRADGKLHQARGSCAPDLIREARRGELPVPVVKDRIRARVVAESLFEQNLVRPGLIPPDGEVRRPIPNDRIANGILDSGLGATDVGPKFFRAEAMDIVVPVAVAGDLMTLARNPAHAPRMTIGDLA